MRSWLLGEALPAQNPQTWTRVTRIHLRGLASELGNEAMKLINRWPASGEGREIKAATERVAQLLAGQQPTRSLERAYGEISKAAEEFESVLANRFFQEEMAGRPLAGRKPRSRSMDEWISGSISEARNFIRENPVPKPSAAEGIEKLVPQVQKIGPAQFEVSEGVLRLRHGVDEPAERDRQNVDRARASLVAEGSWLIENLVGSNADRRLVDLIQDMQERLRSTTDVIQLAIANMSCQLVADRFEDEFSPVLAGRMNGYTAAIGMYVGQFPEWIRFSENAAMAEYDAADIRAIHSAGIDLVASLREASTTVDPEVPHTLAWMLEAIADPRKAVRRTVFAAIRTIENLVAAVLRASGMVLGGAVTGAQKGVQLATKGIVAVSLLTAAANVAIRVSPASVKILQASWLGKAGKLVLGAIAKDE